MVWTDDDCLDYVEWLRWGDAFVCPGVAMAGAGGSVTGASCAGAAVPGRR